jgi:DNA-binding NarL/FixJ family response regulator
MGVSVLIVDDQAPFRLAARAVVEATDGFDVVGEVETGEAALDAARELRPDLVLMDVNLPGISGLEATRVILAEGDEPRPLVIVFSTYEPAEYAPRAAEAGAVGYITKSELSPERLEEVWAAAQNGRPDSA